MREKEKNLLEKELSGIAARVQDNVKRVRKALGMSQFGLYHDSGLRPSIISNIENSRCGVGIIMLVRLVYAFNKNYDGPLGEITLDDIVFTDKLDITKPRMK